jgi:hypothetical protein
MCSVFWSKYSSGFSMLEEFDVLIRFGSSVLELLVDTGRFPFV